MKIEVLVSTMNQKDLSIVNKMNIQTNSIIINQTNFNSIEVTNTKERKIKLVNCDERGLSKSRNKAILNSEADICIIADDDVIYNDRYYDIVKKAYELYKDADIIAFEVPTTNETRKQRRVRKNEYIGYFKSGKIASFQMTFKRKSLVEKNLKFDEMFGAGARYSCGEENILLFEAIKDGLKIVRVSDSIGIVTHDTSTWFDGYTKKYFEDKGAIFYRMTSKYSSILILQFAFRKYGLYKNDINIVKAIKYMNIGRKEYRNIKKYKSRK